MTEEPATLERYRRLAELVCPGATLVRSWPLTGGVSAFVTALELALPDGATERIVVRRHGAIDKGHNPDIAADEYRVLQVVTGAGVPAPVPLLLDATGELLGSSGLVTSFVDGTTELPPDRLPGALDRMASFLARVHGLDLGKHDLSFLPRRDDPTPQTLHHVEAPSAAPFTDRERATLARVEPARANPPVLLHGDFWPGNIMWRDGEIAAVLDWEDAAIGDPLADLAGCRIELLWAVGEDAMQQFTELYASLVEIDLTDLPLWELCAATGALAYMGSWGLEPVVEAAMRARAHELMEQSIAALGGQ